MNVSRLEKIYAVIILVIFGGIVLHAPLSVGFGTLFPDYDLLIKSWKEILMVGLIPLAFIIVSERQLWRQLATDWIFRLIIAYAALHLVMVAVLYQGSAATAAGLAIDLRYILFFGLVYVLIKAMPTYRRRLLQVGVIGACIVVGFAALQLFLPANILSHIGYGPDTIAASLMVDKNPDYVRVNSTLRGPNPLGAYVVIVLALLVAAAVRGKLSLRDKKVVIATALLAACSVIALWISYSRSALVAAVAAVGIVIGATVARGLSRRSWIIMSVVVFAVIGGLVAARNSDFVTNVILHDNSETGAAVTSNAGHISSLQHGAERLLEQPFGAGVGSTGSASLYSDAPNIIENQYLFVAHETGWLGLALFMAIFVLILWRLWRGRQNWLSLGVFASGVGLALIGLLLPVWADDTVAIIWWALAATAIAIGGNND